MNPQLAAGYFADDHLAYAEFLRNFPLCSSIHKCVTYLKNSGLGKFGVRIFASVVDASFDVTSLLHHVIDIVLPSSQEKMIRTDAGTIVASMQHPKGIRDRSMMQKPGRLGGKNQMSCGPRNVSVAVSVKARRPQPAPIRDLHLCPEAFDEGWRKALRSEEIGFIEGPLEKLHNSSWVGSRRMTLARGRLIERRVKCP